MRKPAYDPCIPTRGTKVPDRPEWFHEIKHDGYRLIVQREGKTVRLWTRNGYDWSSRYPRIVEAALRHRPDSFVMDGEAVLLGIDGIADFNGLHSRKHDDEVQLYAFDLLTRGRRSSAMAAAPAKEHLAKMLRRRVDGIILNDFQQGEIGPELFRHACLMGLEGILSKHKDQPYRAGRSKHWIKVKNRTSPA